MSDSADRNEAAYQDILERLKRGEGNCWRETRERHAAVAEATFWRLVRRARQNLAGEESVAKARQQLADHVAAGPVAAGPVAVPLDNRHGEAVQERLNNIPSIGDAFRNLDLLGQIKRQLADVELLRQYALGADGKVRAPMFLAQSISLRDRLIGTAMRLVEAVWDLETQFKFYDSLVEKVAATDPELARAIVEDLKACPQTQDGV